MVMSHRVKAYRGNPPDYFAPMMEAEPARALGFTQRWEWTDDPDWNVEVCAECDFTRGKQCKPCAAVRAKHRTDNY
jgi:hypothetical protein